MNLIAVVSGRTNDPEGTVVLLALFGLLVYGVWGLIRWLREGPSRPEPWGDQVAAEIADDLAPALCHRCLTPHDASADFCPECGAAVGPYTNWLPYPQLFSIGHTLRIGTAGSFKHSALTIVGFFLFGLVEYALFAPVYWFVFLRNLSREQQAEPVAEPGPGESGGGPGTLP
jgi:hypothetical protein